MQRKLVKQGLNPLWLAPQWIDWTNFLVVEDVVILALDIDSCI